MTVRRVLIAIILPCLACIQTPRASEPSASSTPSIEIGRVRTLFRVALDIRAGDTALVIPVCDTDALEELFLCSLASELQVQSSQGWVPAPTPRVGPLLGGISLDRAKASVVQPGSSTRFVFQFAKHVYVLGKGQQLRVVVHAWPDEVAMRSNGPKIHIEGPVFTLP